MVDDGTIQGYETELLGAALCDPVIANSVVERLRVNDLYLARSKKIFECLSRVIAKELPLDLKFIALEVDDLEGLDPEDRGTLKTEIEVMASPLNEEYANLLIDKIKEHAYRRVYTGLLMKQVERSRIQGATTDELLTGCENDLITLKQTQQVRHSARVNFGEAVWSWAATVMHKKGGLETGFPTLDRLLGDGLGKGELIILAARPSVGKTTMVMNMLQHISFTNQLSSLFVTLEMTPASLVERYVCQRRNMVGAQLEEDDVADILDEFSEELEKEKFGPRRMPLEFVSGTYQIDQIESVARELSRELKSKNDNLSCIVIDYLQCMSLPEENRMNNRNYDIGEITKRIKRLAMELQVPIVVLSQLSRSIENSPMRRTQDPKLSDLRDSGEIENHADVVLFLKPTSDSGKGEERRVELVIGKNRNGPLGTVKLLFNGRRFYFREEGEKKPKLDENLQ